MSTDAPIKINQQTRGDNRYYHLRSHRIHPQSMDMFESRISFALDNKEMIEEIDSDENAKNNFMDVLVKIKEEILSQEGKENKAIFQMFLFIEIKSTNGIPTLNAQEFISYLKFIKIMIRNILVLKLNLQILVYLFMQIHLINYLKE